LLVLLAFDRYRYAPKTLRISMSSTFKTLSSN
jgi:hypothetical protein